MGAGGRRWGTHQLVYVAEVLDQLLLSREACQSLGIIGKDFPTIGSHGQADTMEMAVADEPVPNIALDDPELPTPCSPRSDNSCDCPRREEPPPLCPPGMSATQLKVIITRHYAASSFNICTRQPLPIMTGELMPIVTDPNATPTAVHTPIPVPLHWTDKVKQDLDRDVALGIIKPVPLNTPTTWCARMVVVPKHDGTPRRTVDFKALNNASMRQTHHTRSPFMAADIPANTKKSVLNAYHSVAIRR